MSSIPVEYENDDEVLGAFLDFTINCSAAYVRAVRDNDQSGGKLQHSGKMSKSQIMNFVDSVNFLMMQPATHAALHEEYVKSGNQDPNEMVVKMQKDMLESLGIQKDFGVSRLNCIGKDFANDREMHAKMQSLFQWAMKSVQQAKMSPEELREAELDKLRHARMAMEKHMEQQRQGEQHKREVFEKVKQVQAAITKMSEEEKAEFVSRWQPKWDTLRRLPPKEQMEYMQRQSAEDQANFAKINMMKQMESSNNQMTPNSPPSSNKSA